MSGQPTHDPDIIVYRLCTLLGCTPSQLESEDPVILEKFLVLDSMAQAKRKKMMEDAKNA